jgi:hypothetical protein
MRKKAMLMRRDLYASVIASEPVPDMTGGEAAPDAGKKPMLPRRDLYASFFLHIRRKDTSYA